MGSRSNLRFMLTASADISLSAPNYVGAPTVVTWRWVFPNTLETENELEYWDFETLAIQRRKRAHRIRCWEGCRHCLGTGVATSPPAKHSPWKSEVPHWPLQHRLTHTGRTCGLFSLDIEHLLHFFESLMRFFEQAFSVCSSRKTDHHVPILFFEKTDVYIEPSLMKAQYWLFLLQIFFLQKLTNQISNLHII